MKSQAYKFSPAYREFILKILKSNSLKIVSSHESYITGLDDELESLKPNLNRRRTNKIFTDIHDSEALPHELGHAVDFWFGENQSLTKTVVIEDGKTLYDIFTQEFLEKKEQLYQIVMDEYRQIINSNINKDAFYILMSNIDLYRRLLKLPVNEENRKERKRIQKTLYQNGFVEVYYQTLTKKCYSILNKKYSPILDALSSQYDFDGLFLDHHEASYYKSSKYKAVYEFFANVFADKVTSNHVHFDNLIKYLPQSFKAFEKLFVIFYDHLQNNKRFTDVPVVKEIRYEL